MVRQVPVEQPCHAQLQWCKRLKIFVLFLVNWSAPFWMGQNLLKSLSQNWSNDFIAIWICDYTRIVHSQAPFENSFHLLRMESHRCMIFKCIIFCVNQDPKLLASLSCWCAVSSLSFYPVHVIWHISQNFMFTTTLFHGSQTMKARQHQWNCKCETECHSSTGVQQHCDPTDQQWASFLMCCNTKCSNFHLFHHSCIVLWHWMQTKMSNKCKRSVKSKFLEPHLCHFDCEHVTSIIFCWHWALRAPHILWNQPKCMAKPNQQTCVCSMQWESNSTGENNQASCLWLWSESEKGRLALLTHHWNAWARWHPTISKLLQWWWRVASGVKGKTIRIFPFNRKILNCANSGESQLLFRWKINDLSVTTVVMEGVVAKTTITRPLHKMFGWDFPPLTMTLWAKMIWCQCSFCSCQISQSMCVSFDKQLSQPRAIRIETGQYDVTYVLFGSRQPNGSPSPWGCSWSGTMFFSRKS